MIEKMKFLVIYEKQEKLTKLFCFELVATPEYAMQGLFSVKFDDLALEF